MVKLYTLINTKDPENQIRECPPPPPGISTRIVLDRNGVFFRGQRQGKLSSIKFECRLLVWNTGYWVSWATRSLLPQRLPGFIPLKIQFELAGNSSYPSSSYRSSTVNAKHVLSPFPFPVASDFRPNNRLFLKTVFCAHKISYQLWFRSKQEWWPIFSCSTVIFRKVIKPSGCWR